ncbi:hypothetical protein KKB18_13620, partial [bacterium]|nr:hypothetical protein [bacterium]
MSERFKELKKKHESLRKESGQEDELLKVDIQQFLNDCVKESVYIYDPDYREELCAIVTYWASLLSSITGKNIPIPMLKSPIEDSLMLDSVIIKKYWPRDRIKDILDSKIKVILSGDLRGMDLEGLDFTNVDTLKGVDLSASYLKGVKFRKNMVFQNVDLIGTDMEGVEC